MPSKRPETKERTKERLLETGQWMEFREARDVFKAQGHAPIDANNGALALYPDPSWSEELIASIAIPTALKSDTPPKEVKRVITEKPLSVETKTKKKMVSKDKVKQGAKDVVGDMMWIYDNMAVEGLTIDDAPSSGAYSLLIDCQNDKTVKQSFRKDIFAKLIPSRSVLENAEKLKTSDTKTEELLQRLSKKLEE